MTRIERALAALNREAAFDRQERDKMDARLDEASGGDPSNPATLHLLAHHNARIAAILGEWS